MDIETLNKNLKRACLANGMCNNYLSDWLRTKTYQELIDTMKSDPLFIYRVPYIRNEMISNYFSHDLLNQNDVYIDNDEITTVNTNSIFFFGKSSGNLSLNSGTYNFYLYEDSELILNLSEKCEVKVFLCESGKCTINTIDIEKKPIVEILSESCYINKENDDIMIFNRPLFSKDIKDNYQISVTEIL